MSVVEKLYSPAVTISLIIGLAIVQLFVQLFFFLHIRSETKPRWRAIILAFASLIILIVVVGSLWIMYNLDYNMMHSVDMDQHIIEDEGINVEMQHHSQ